MTHLLDSSAFFAFFFDEPGRKRVESLLQDPSATVGLSVMTAVEFWACLKAGNNEQAFEREWNDHLPLFESLIPADLAVCLKAVELRRGTKGRLPAIDSIIAASAAAEDAILVHRDPHFTAIPARLLKQQRLSDR